MGALGQIRVSHAYVPELADDSYAEAVRRNPLLATLIAAAVVSSACLLLAR